MTRKKIFFLILLLFSVVSYSQQRINDICLIEKNIVQENDKEYSLYVSFRISFDDLIFSKEDSAFSSGAEFFCEVFDKDKLVERKSVNRSVLAPNYEVTTSSDKYLQGVLKFRIYNSVFSIRPSIQRANTNILIPLKEIQLDLLNSPKKARPVIVKSIPGKNGYELVNRGNSVLYDVNRYTLLIPIPDSIANPKIQLLQKSKTLLDTTIAEIKNYIADIIDDNGVLIAKMESKSGTVNRYARIDIPKTVDEGDLQINIEAGSKKIIFNVPVIWIDKPFILHDLDLSINLMKIIEDEKSIDGLLKQQDENKYSLLKEEWNRITKSGNNGINLLMKEFYTRADYAMNNFSYNGKRNGTETDRGRMYLQFGKPDSIERKYNDKNDIIEIWKYENLKREYIFEDNSGKGNYILRN